MFDTLVKFGSILMILTNGIIIYMYLRMSSRMSEIEERDLKEYIPDNYDLYEYHERELAREERIKIRDENEELFQSDIEE